MHIGRSKVQFYNSMESNNVKETFLHLEKNITKSKGIENKVKYKYSQLVLPNRKEFSKNIEFNDMLTKIKTEKKNDFHFITK